MLYTYLFGNRENQSETDIPNTNNHCTGISDGTAPSNNILELEDMFISAPEELAEAQPGQDQKAPVVEIDVANSSIIPGPKDGEFYVSQRPRRSKYGYDGNAGKWYDEELNKALKEKLERYNASLLERPSKSKANYTISEHWLEKKSLFKELFLKDGDGLKGTKDISQDPISMFYGEQREAWVDESYEDLIISTNRFNEQRRKVVIPLNYGDEVLYVPILTYNFIVIFFFAVLAYAMISKGVDDNLKPSSQPYNEYIYNSYATTLLKLMNLGVQVDLAKVLSLIITYTAFIFIISKDILTDKRALRIMFIFLIFAPITAFLYKYDIGISW